MQGAGLVGALPFWGIFLGTLLIVLVAVECGYSWAKYKQRLAAHEREREKEAPVGAMVGAALGLLALLLAFTFDKGADHFHARRMALVDESHAIQTTYLRTALIGEPQRTEVRKILRAYAEECLDRSKRENIKAAHACRQLLDRLWVQSASFAEKNVGLPAAALFINSVNDVIRENAERREASASRIPGAFWVVLYLMAFVSLAAMGYHCGVAGTIRSPVMLAVAITFSLVIVLIIDLDRPGDGWINVSEDSVIELRKSLVDSNP